MAKRHEPLAILAGRGSSRQAHGALRTVQRQKSVVPLHHRHRWARRRGGPLRGRVRGKRTRGGRSQIGN